MYVTCLNGASKCNLSEQQSIKATIQPKEKTNVFLSLIAIR